MKRKPPYNVLNNSVSTPVAQITNLCGVGCGSPSELEPVEYALAKVSSYPVQIKLIVLLQARYGLRISEVLEINVYDIGRSGMITIKGSKGSANRVVYAPEYEQYLTRCVATAAQPFQGIDRFYVYRIYKKVGFVYKSSRSRNLSVTHSFRHQLISQMRSEGVEPAVISAFIGHKRSENTERYGND